MKINSYKELIVWQKSIELVVKTYKATATYPKTEMYALTNQTRRSAVSIASNIAEGWARNHLNEYTQFLYISLGSAAELETQLLIANKLSFLSEADSVILGGGLAEIMKMLNGLINKLQEK